MSNQSEIKRVYFDFSNVDLLVRDTVFYLKSHKRNLSKYVCKAYNYSVLRPQEKTQRKDELLFEFLKIQYFAKKNKISNKEQLYTFLENCSLPKQVTKYPKANRMLLSFRSSNMLEFETYNHFKDLANKDKVAELVRIARHYMLSGFDTTYLDFEADKVLEALKTWYEEQNFEMIDKVAGIIESPLKNSIFQ